jgi:hypothetical protein
VAAQWAWHGFAYRLDSQTPRPTLVNFLGFAASASAYDIVSLMLNLDPTLAADPTSFALYVSVAFATRPEASREAAQGGCRPEFHSRYTWSIPHALRLS